MKYVLPGICWLLWAGCFDVSLLVSEDIVYLNRSGIKSGRTRFLGTISDYDSEKLSLTTTDGRGLEINAERIKRIETIHLPVKETADRLFGERKFSLAYESYAKAISAEKREWVRRQLIAQQVLCLSAQQKNEAAIDVFLKLTAKRANHRFFHVIPLSWDDRNLASPPAERLEKLLSGNPLEQLIGASWLLDGESRQSSLKVLKSLAETNTGTELMKRISQIAQFQVGRSELAERTAADIAEWKQRISNLAPPDRPGPIWLTAKWMFQQEFYSAAAIEFMKLPILYPDQYQLGASALELASVALERSGQTGEAGLVLRELATGYTTTVPGRRAAEKRSQKKSPE